MYKVAVVTQFENDYDKYIDKYAKMNKFDYVWTRYEPFIEDRFIKIVKATHYDRVKDVEDVLYACVKQLIIPIGIASDNPARFMTDPNEIYLVLEDRNDAKGTCFKDAILDSNRHELLVAFNTARHNINNYEQFMVARRNVEYYHKKVTRNAQNILSLKKKQEEEERIRMNEEREAYFRSRLGIKH